jgi:hypothetical protein
VSRRLGLRQYAAHRRRLGLPGGTLSAVQAAIEYGRITRGPDGRIDVAVADADWARTTDPARRPMMGPVIGTGPAIATTLCELRDALGDVTGPLWRLSGSQTDMQFVLTTWVRLPKLLDAVEDAVIASGILRARVTRAAAINATDEGGSAS